MRLAPAGALLLALAGCGGGGGNEGAERPGTVSVAMQSEDAVDGRRPVLTLSCGPAGASFWLALIRVPDASPGNAFATIKLDDGAPQRIGLVWLGGDKWAPALEARAETDLTRAMVAAGSIYFLGPEGTTERAYRWDMSRLGSGIDELRRGCG